MSDLVDLGLKFRSLSTNITPQGVTAHYGGPSPWRGFRTDHNRCPAIVRSWHAYHLSKGWSGLAYSAVVCPHGTIYKGRWRGKRTAANGTNPGNQRSYAVCYLAGDNDGLLAGRWGGCQEGRRRLTARLGRPSRRCE